MEKNIEFYQKRREHRRQMREILPPSLQLEFPQKEKWSFEGRLLKLRKSEEPEDRLFFETLRMKMKESLEKKVEKADLEKIKALEKSVMAKKEKIIYSLEIIILYERGIKDSDWKVRQGTAQSLGELAKVNPEKYLSLYERGIKDSDWDVRQGTAQSLGELAKLIDSKVVEKIEEILDKSGIVENFHLYAIFQIENLLKEKKDLAELRLEYWPKFEVLKQYSQEINQELPKEKQTANPEEFLEKYQLEIAKLHSLDIDLSTSWLNEYLKKFGFPRLERFFENVVRGFNPQPLKEVLPKIKNIDPEYFSRLVEISSAYQRMNLDEKLNEVLTENTKEGIEAQELNRILGQELLNEFAKKLNIETKIKENAFDKWNLEYLPKLFTAEAQYEQESKEFLKIIMKLSFQEKSFLAALFGKVEGEYTEDEKESLEEIKKYNLKVKEEFEKNGLDFNQWLNYEKKLDFNVGTAKDQLENKRRGFEQELISTVKELLGSFREKKKGILSDEEAKIIFNKVIKKYGLQFKDEGIVHPEKGKFSVRDIGVILADFNSEIEKIHQGEGDKAKKENIGTALAHLKDLAERLPDLEKELLKKGFELEIKTWQREPGYDIFQGNYTHCCVAVENFNQGAMLDYLVDTNLQVIEIKDKVEDKTIAQTWLFVAKDSQGNLNLILDNVEINSDYQGLESQIKENLFNYLKEYTKVFGQGKIKRILLGASAYNDVETKGLNSTSLTITKLGGAPRETEYLDAFGSAWVDPSKETLKLFFIVAEDLEKPEAKKKEKKEKIQISEIRRLDADLLVKINELEKSCFPEDLRTPAEQYLEMDGLHLLLKKENEIIGNLSAIEAEEVPTLVDKNHLNKETLYIWTIAIKPEERSLSVFSNLIKEFQGKAKEKGIKKLVMHARVQEHLSDVLQSRYGAKKIRRVENWLDSGEPFDYLEIDLERK